MSPTRDEEGVAIISKHPIVASDYAILSRDAADEQDEHARVCLHAVISVPDIKIGLIDVYSVHMPLSPTARNRTTVEVARFIKASRLGAVQILLGDMNDEPHNASMQFWSGQSDLEVPGLPADSAIGVGQPFLDAWLEIHSEPEPPLSTDRRLREKALCHCQVMIQRSALTLLSSFQCLQPSQACQTTDQTANRPASRCEKPGLWASNQCQAPETAAILSMSEWCTLTAHFGPQIIEG